MFEVGTKDHGVSLLNRLRRIRGAAFCTGFFISYVICSRNCNNNNNI